MGLFFFSFVILKPDPEGAALVPVCLGLFSGCWSFVHFLLSVCAIEGEGGELPEDGLESLPPEVTYLPFNLCMNSQGE